MSKQSEALKHAQEWQAVVDSEISMKAIDAAAGHNTSCNDARIKTYSRVVEAFKLEHATGKPHCSCCLKPATECPSFRG